MILIEKIGKNMEVLKKNPKIVLYYLIGNYRYYIYYSKFRWLLRKSVIKTIERLLKNIDTECFNQASCKKCGCKVPQQNFGGKPCDCAWLSINGKKLIINKDYF